MERNDPGDGMLENMNRAKKRSLDAFLGDPALDTHDTPSKRLYCPESLSSRVIDWLSQLPPQSGLEAGSNVEDEVDPDTMLSKKDKGKGKGKGKSKGKSDGSAVGGLATPSLAPASRHSRAASPAGTGQTGQTGESGQTSKTARLVERSDYLELMEREKIYFLEENEPRPKYVSDFCDRMAKPRTSPEPTPEEALREMRELKEFQHYGTLESGVETGLKLNLFPHYRSVREEGLQVLPQATFQQCLPHTTASKMSKPIPGLAYGYSTNRVRTPFTKSQQIAGWKMDPPLGKVDAQKTLSFPFFVIEFKGLGPTNENCWVATNQCLGGSTTCVEAVSRLNSLLQEYPGARPVGNMAFSIAMSQRDAEIYVSWKTDELEYYMQEAACFYLKKPQDFIEFRRYVKNILDWGKGPRLREIQEALDTILEQDRKIASGQAKQRLAPSTTSGGSAPKRLQSAPPNSSPPPASRASSSRTQSDRFDRISPPAVNRSNPQTGYQSTSAASAASGPKSYQYGASTGHGDERSSRASSGSGGDQVKNSRPSPRPETSASGSGSYVSSGSRLGSAGGQDISSRPPPPPPGSRPGSTPSRSNHDDGGHAPRYSGPSILNPKQQPKPRSRSGGYDDGRSAPPPTRSSGSSAPRPANYGQKSNATSRDPFYRGDSSSRNQFPNDYDRRW